MNMLRVASEGRLNGPRKAMRGKKELLPAVAGFTVPGLLGDQGAHLRSSGPVVIRTKSALF
jgi:hypothetical protein